MGVIWWEKLEVLGAFGGRLRRIFVKKSVITCGGESLIKGFDLYGYRRGVIWSVDACRRGELYKRF